jgi:hypothetical protein
VNNDYAIEIFQGPLLAPIHVTGVGGAYIASAEGTEGAAVNSAAPAVRDSYSTKWLDYDVTLGASIPGAFTQTDFDNHGDFNNVPGHARAGDFLDVDFGAQLQLGGFGTSATGDLTQYTLSSPAQGEPGLTLRLVRARALAAYGLFEGQLVVGGGARIAAMQVIDAQNSTLLTMTGVAPEVGALLMPTGRQWRIGASARAPVSGGIFGSENVRVNAANVRAVGPLVLPSRVVMPWELEVGIAYQLGPRPLNPGWLNPHEEEGPVRRRIDEDRAARERAAEDELAKLPPGRREAREAELAAQEKSLRAIEDDRLAAESERLRKIRVARYANWPREKVLLLASVLVTGPSDKAVSIEGFLDQRVETVGRGPSLTPRLGMEGEPLQDRMLLRVGTYVEPSRYDNGTPRQHFTFGADVKLIPLDFWGLLSSAVWKIGVFIDVAARYTNGGIAIGNWH